MQQTAAIPIHHVWHEDRGFRLTSIRNKAIAHSSGEYLIQCDDDSIPARTLVEDHLNCAEEGCFVQGHRVLLGPAVSESFSFRDARFWNVVGLGLQDQAQNVANALHLPRALARKSRELRGIRGCNLSFFRRHILAVNGFNEDMDGWGKDDTELAVRFYKYGLKRKDMRFQGVCYHLYHAPYSRENLGRNIAILEKTQQNAAYRCSRGLDQYLRR